MKGPESNVSSEGIILDEIEAGRVSCLVFRASCFGFQVSSFGFRISCCCFVLRVKGPGASGLQVCLAESVHKIVLQKSIPPQICQLILHYHLYTE
jgi:hypothetical protein